jgi:mannose-6-phosphate isomerase-like protein (cupin superfamily)
MTMEFSRRDLAFLIPALATAGAVAQQRQASPLPSKAYHNDRIPYEGDAKKKGRQFFTGRTHGGFTLEAHETILGPAVETHAPHKHLHEEIVIVVEGTVEWYLEGRTEMVEAGSVIYFGSNQMHSIRNAGSAPCRYYVVELRGDQA